MAGPPDGRCGDGLSAEDNCFPWIADVAGAQALMDRRRRQDWPALLRPLMEECHPLCAEITRPIERDYCWTAAESEYATDVMFRDGRRWSAFTRRWSVAVIGFGARTGAALRDDRDGLASTMK